MSEGREWVGDMGCIAWRGMVLGVPGYGLLVETGLDIPLLYLSMRMTPPTRSSW